MGSYRLLLAILVALSHMYVLLFSCNPGVIAVISFYLISGYVMSSLIERYYKNPFNALGFYLDRAARLFPQFIFYLMAGTICAYLLKLPDFSKFSPGRWLLDSLIIPTGFYMFRDKGDFHILPQTWSLGLEMTFYLIIPWLAKYSSPRLIAIVMMGSMAVFAAGYIGIINFDWYSYRLLPGTLFIFITGSLFYSKDRIYLLYIVFVYAYVEVLFLIGNAFNIFHTIVVTHEVIIGLLIGIPALGILKKFKFSALDEFLGNLSYGVFLNHYMVIWVMDKLLATHHHKGLTTHPQEEFLSVYSEGGLWPIISVILISCALSFISYTLVETPAIKWRRKIRDKQASLQAA